MPNQTISLPLFIEPARAGSYFTLPFSMPAGTAALTLTYHYERRRESDAPVDKWALYGAPGNQYHRPGIGRS